jgi:hypothetical protein
VPGPMAVAVAGAAPARRQTESVSVLLSKGRTRPDGLPGDPRGAGTRPSGHGTRVRFAAPGPKPGRQDRRASRRSGDDRRAGRGGTCSSRFGHTLRGAARRTSRSNARGPPRRHADRVRRDPARGGLRRRTRRRATAVGTHELGGLDVTRADGPLRRPADDGRPGGAGRAIRSRLRSPLATGAGNPFSARRRLSGPPGLPLLEKTSKLVAAITWQARPKPAPALH